MISLSLRHRHTLDLFDIFVADVADVADVVY